MPNRTAAAGATLAMLALVTLAGCGTSSTAPETGSSTTTKTTPSTSATSSPSTSAAAGGSQHLTITPSTGLKSSQKVTVKATGFSPNQPLVVTECAAKGHSTSANDCNLAGIVPTKSDSSGNVDVDFTVTKGPFGSAKVVCSASQPCLISVTQATPKPTQEADAQIKFG